MPDLTPLSPDWWLARLFSQLMVRREMIDFYDAYYTGDHPLPWLAPQARQEFRRILRMTRSNYMGLVVDSQVERIQVEGFRFGNDGTADAETWRIFQANNLDSDSDQAILEAAITGQSYLLVAPNPKDATTPCVWVEHPAQAIIAYEPGGRRVRVAGLKVWDDDYAGGLLATLYLPDAIYKWKAPARAGGYAAIGQAPDWTQRQVTGENWPAPNPLAAVPLVEIANNPRLLIGGVSELSDVTDIQDRVNKTIADRLITQDYGAFPQKWATAWPEEDAQGNPNPPIDIGRSRLVTTEVQETKFGQWDAAPLDPYSTAKREDVKDIASRTRTPAQYLLGEMSNVNAQALALDTPIPTPSGLVAIGDMRDGDEVYDERGVVQVVEQAHPVLYGQACYRITLDDGTEFIADAGHRWPVVSIPERKRSMRGIAQRTEHSVMNTEDIASTLLASNGQKVHAIELADAPDGPEVDLPVDPYVMGVYLGDGSRHLGTISSGQRDVDAMVELLREAGESPTVRPSRTCLTITCGRPDPTACLRGHAGTILNGKQCPVCGTLGWRARHHGDPMPAIVNESLRGRLNRAGVLFAKFIPEAYFHGSFKQRLALLQGLMDTDGTAEKLHANTVELRLDDKRLARDAFRLICSLGHKVRMRTVVKKDAIDPQGTIHAEVTTYDMRWCPPDIVFRMPRKAAVQQVRPEVRPKTLRRTIVAVTPVASVPVRCLTVSGSSHLYLAGVQHVPTHNTLKASESGLISKVKQRRRAYAEGFEEAMRLARLAAGISGDQDEAMETLFSDPEFRTEGELTQATVLKLQTNIISIRQAREDLGYTAAQIARLEQDDADAAANNDAEVQATARRLIDASGVTGASGTQRPATTAPTVSIGGADTNSSQGLGGSS